MALDTHHEADKDKVGLTAELKGADSANEQLKLSHQD